MKAPIINQSETVGTRNIPVRRMDFEFDDAIPLYWFGNDPIRTMVLTALSCTFPEGERMFMRSVRHYQPQIKDPELLKQVRAFIGQEAHHGKEHQGFNDLMKRKGLPIDSIEKFVKAAIAREESWWTPERMLAKTCALEHFTAMFAEVLLEHPELLEQFDERLQPLWLWHAIEESEHKSVAFDVYQDQAGSYWTRTSEMAVTTVLFTFFSSLHAVHLLSETQQGLPLKSIQRNLRDVWKHRKVALKMGKHYLDYYRPNFHPSQKNSDWLRRKGLKILQKYVGDKAIQSE